MAGPVLTNADDLVCAARALAVTRICRQFRDYQ